MRLLNRLLELKPSILSRQAIQILRSYGTNAHAYIPGIGTINGLTAGNYLLADGSTGATPVDGLTGLVLDSAGSVGAELVTNGGPFTATTGWASATGVTLSAVSGALRSTSSVSGASARIATQTVSGLTIGETYQVTSSVLSFGGAGAQAANPSIQIRDAADTVTTATINAQAATNTTILGYFVATGTSHRIRPRWDGNASTDTSSYLDFGSVSLKAVSGIHATSTGAARPTLRLTSGKYSHSYAGAQSLTLGSVPFQMSDDHCVIASFKPTILANHAPVAVATNTGTFSKQACIALTVGGTIYARWTSDAPIDYTSSPVGTYTAGATLVASAKKVSSTGYSRVNGVQIGTVSLAAMASSTLNTGLIGSEGFGASPFTGSIGPVIAIKGTVSDADLLTLERFVASLTPNAPTF